MTYFDNRTPDFGTHSLGRLIRGAIKRKIGTFYKAHELIWHSGHLPFCNNLMQAMYLPAFKMVKCKTYYILFNWRNTFVSRLAIVAELDMSAAAKKQCDV